MRILVVEDDRRVGAFLEQGLRDEGYEVDRAVTGDEALSRRRVSHHDLILLDHMLPGKTGVEVARSLRASGDQTPILMLTARDGPEDRQSTLAAGVNAFMGKPFRFDDLITEIRSLLPAEP